MDNLAYIVNSSAEYDALFKDQPGWDRGDSIWGASLIVFTGGEDVTPALYNEKPLDSTHYNTNRDRFERYAYNTAREFNIPMVGICRGAQFLNVMNRGSLWQDVDGHAISGEHSLLDPTTGLVLHGVRVTSTHHQMMRATKDAMVIAVAEEASYKRAEKEHWNRKDSTAFMFDIEVLWYEETKCLCFQPHPEHYEAFATKKYFFELLKKHVDLY